MSRPASILTCVLPLCLLAACTSLDDAAIHPKATTPASTASPPAGGVPTLDATTLACLSRHGVTAPAPLPTDPADVQEFVAAIQACGAGGLPTPTGPLAATTSTG
jgi:hypothetical protein